MTPRNGRRDGDATFMLRLYVAGRTPNSTRARDNLTELCERHLPGRHAIEVVDVLEEPRRALEAGILVAPTLVKLSPAPSRVVIGDLGDEAVVLLALEVDRDGQ